MHRYSFESLARVNAAERVHEFEPMLCLDVFLLDSNRRLRLQVNSNFSIPMQSLVDGSQTLLSVLKFYLAFSFHIKLVTNLLPLSEPLFKVVETDTSNKIRQPFCFRTSLV